MEMPSISLLSITPLYVALLGLIWIVMTLRVGLYRVKNEINIGDGGDPEMQRRVRGQGNFIESVPLAVALLLVMELVGASDTWLHALGATLVLGRLLHYVGLTEIGPFQCRPAGMFATLGVYLISSGWILVDLYL
ncbi:MAG: MAPEG family protein [Halieaceae bacterium]